VNTAEVAQVALDAGAIQRGLRELNPSISFDAVVNRPSDNYYVLQGCDHMEDLRGGVYYNGEFLCAMDRGVVAEHPVWETAPGYVEIPMVDFERYDDVKKVYVQVLPTDAGYNEALSRAERKDDNYSIDEDGKVFKWQCLREANQVPYRILHIGWRELFAHLIFRRIPGLTKDALEAKFGVRI
jgi:hypothetical protein